MSTMTDDEARDRFSDAVEGELSAEDRAAFDAALAASAELREDYDAFRAMMQGTAKIAASTEAEVEAETPEILEKVQYRLYKRSKGRYYRDRFARGSGPRSTTMLLAIVAVLTVMAAVLALQNLVVIDDEPAPSTTTSP